MSVQENAEKEEKQPSLSQRRLLRPAGRGKQSQLTWASLIDSPPNQRIHILGELIPEHP